MVFKTLCFIIYTSTVPTVYSELEFNDIANVLALNLFNVMPDTSLVASTLMVRLPLIKLAAYATGETKDQMMLALGHRNESWMLGTYRRMSEVLSKLQLMDLIFINKIYVNVTNDIDPDFFTNSELQYGVKVEKVSFNYPKAVASFINKCMLGTYRRMSEVLSKLQLMDLIFINKIYVNVTNDIDPDFFTNSELQYGVKVEKVSFNYPKAVASFINKCMGSSTLRRITEVVDENDITKNTTMVIVSGVYFKATWEFPFNYERTKLRPFHYRNGSVSHVQMMMRLDYYDYVDTGEYQAVKLHLTWSNTNMIFILPHNKEALPQLLTKIYENTTYMTPFLNRMTHKLTVVKIPRFKIKTYVDWTGFLQELGMYSLFDCNSTDLLEMLQSRDPRNNKMCLNKIKQKVFLEVDEMGVLKRIFSKIRDGGPMEELADELHSIQAKEVTFDRPFLFMVNIHFSDIHNHELLTGVYYGPE